MRNQALSHQEVIEKLYALRKSGMRLHRRRVQRALSARGNPEQGLPIVHIAGTNGKGSTAAMVASIGRAAGLRSGLFTSPHMHRFVERIQLNGRPLGEKEASKRLSELWSKQNGKPGFPALSFFETLTVLALEVFRDKQCELVVLETGLGGRLDATNVAKAPRVTAITQIALDHRNILGNTLGRIAKEKAGIIKQGRPLICSVRDPRAKEVIRRIASQKRAKASWIDEDFGWSRGSGARAPIDVYCGKQLVPGLRPRLPGIHQFDNVAVAVAIAVELRKQGFPTEAEAIGRGVSNVRWPGRLERIGRNPSFLLDAAHNPNGCEVLAKYLAGRPKTKRILLFSAMEDKQYASMLGRLAPTVDKVVLAPVPMQRAASVERLAKVADQISLKSRKARSVAEALSLSEHAAGDGGEVVVAGSLFLVSDVRSRLLGCRAEPLIGL